MEYVLRSLILNPFSSKKPWTVHCKLAVPQDGTASEPFAVLPTATFGGQHCTKERTLELAFSLAAMR
jgi:hypothetical protein